MIRNIAIACAVLTASTAHAVGYRGYCNSCYAPVQKVVQPYDVTNIGNLNQFYAPAPYAQQYPVTDAAYTAAVAEQIQYNLQAVNDQVAQLKAQSQQRLVLVVPQVQAYAVQTETTTTACAPGMQPQQPATPTFSQQQRPGLLQTCLNCHGEGKKAQKHFDMSVALDCDQQKAALLAVVTGQMPKGKRIQLTPEELSAFSDELGAWKQEPEPQPVPPQDQPQPEGENAAPNETGENFSKALNKAGMKLAAQKVVVPIPPTKRAR